MLDSDTCSYALKGRHDIDQRLLALDPADVCISSVTRGEIRFGVAKNPAATSLAERAAAFLAHVRAEPWDERAADRYGEVRAHLLQHGRPIGPLDELIAAHALALDAVLVTNNERHFREVPGLRLENWCANH